MAAPSLNLTERCRSCRGEGRAPLPGYCQRIALMLSTVPQKTGELAARAHVGDERAYAALVRLEEAAIATRAGRLDRSVLWVLAPQRSAAP